MSANHRQSRFGLALCGAALAVAVGLSGCGLVGSSENQLETVVVGSANFTESQLLGEIFAQTLEADGVDVEQQPNIGAREAYMSAIEGDNPSINVLPEYLGYLLEYYKQDIPDTSVPAVTESLNQELPEELEILQISDATDEDAIVVTQETAEKYDLETIGDLAPVADQLVAGGGPEFRTRRAGIAGMREVYGVEFKNFKTLDVAGPLTLKALKNDEVQVADFFTTQGIIEEHNLVVLEDPKNIILPGNIVPVIRDDIPNRDQVEESLNAVMEALTTDALTEMVKSVDQDKEPIDAVAEEFVSQQNLG